ncbi:MAG TPA: tetratricopeptide repeat protein, partial [Bacteroidota bacterium]|nr:tetratricopeptide repeat protein [Bacteroidota bacterium]
AIEDFDIAIELNPKFDKAYSNRGLAKSRLGNYKGAIEDYTTAIGINPDFAIPYKNRGIAKEKLGDKAGAQQDYEKYNELNRK